MKILLVDDDQALLNVFAASLKKNGYEVVTALNGQSGIEKAKTDKPDVILLDQVMPDIQGNEVLKTLKEDPETKAIPVSMLSNFGQKELIQRALDGGAVDYILKYQIEPDYLDTKIRMIIKTKQAQQGSTDPF